MFALWVLFTCWCGLAWIVSKTLFDTFPPCGFPQEKDFAKLPMTVRHEAKFFLYLAHGFLLLTCVPLLPFVALWFAFRVLVKSLAFVAGIIARDASVAYENGRR